MLEQANNRYLVLSDMHFGTLESSVNDARFREAMIDYMVSRAPWEEIVFNGDLLDVNLSTLTGLLRAAPGRTWTRRCSGSGNLSKNSTPGCEGKPQTRG